MKKTINKEKLMNEVFFNMVKKDFNVINGVRIMSYFTLENETKTIDILALNDISFDEIVKEVSTEVDKVIYEYEMQEIIKETFEDIFNIRNNETDDECLSSMSVEDYLINFITDKGNCLQEKMIIDRFLNKYIDKDLYVVEFIRNGSLYLRVENEDDEIVSKELFLGEVVEDSINDYELLPNSDHTVNYHINSILEDQEISDEDKIFMLKDLIQYLNKGLYRQDAEDKYGNMLQLILDQKTDKIIDKIYY